MHMLKDKLISRFVAYAQVNTQSNGASTSCPSTPGQLVLARMLADELRSLGLVEVVVDENGYVMATLPSNLPAGQTAPVVGLIAHLDTATEITGDGVRPRVIEIYEGGDIQLDEAGVVVLKPAEFPELDGYIGQTLLVTDGSTLLGADDKAGIAEIMTALEVLMAHPELPHGKVRIAFTPDEEIGRGADRFDVKTFGADFAYTIDGGPLGELQYENFNAATVRVVIHGRNAHPGSAKGKMVNSVKLAMEFNRYLPEAEAPEYTDGRDGFFHLHACRGEAERTELVYLIREFDRDQYEERKELLLSAAADFRSKYGESVLTMQIRDSYANMLEAIQPVFGIVELARKAMEQAGIQPRIQPIRGGTDGARLSFMGLPTPNLFAGGENMHSRYEYVSADVMVKAVEMLVELVQLSVTEDWRGQAKGAGGA